MLGLFKEADKYNYPTGPCPPTTGCGKSITIDAINLITGEKIKGKDGKTEKETLDLSMYPGEGVNAPPYEAVKYLDLEFNMGVGSGVYYSLLFQLGKWGYERQEVKHSIEVSPVYKEYYTLIMDQKEKLDSQIKNGFAGLIQTIQDYELIDHDLRKYAEYLKWFAGLERAKKALKNAKETGNEIASAQAEYRESQHIIKAMFIDQVDAYTGDSVSLKGIAVRWPTIIGDFFDLYDEDESVEDIQKERDIPKAEAIILKTKHELYREWKNEFLTNIIKRYRSLKQLALGRKFSIEETREDLIPLISRYKAIKDMRSDMKGAAELQFDWNRPDSQAVAMDIWDVWAWKPFTVKEEPYPNTRYSEDKIPLKEAGFNKEERKYLFDNYKITEVPELPATPIMDRHLRNIMKMIYLEHGVRISLKDVVDKITDLSKRYSEPGDFSSTHGGPRWEFSPYFIFLKIPTLRHIIKLPNSGMIEDMIWDGIQTFNITQNILIGRMLEIQAIKENERRQISRMLGYEDLAENGKVTELDEMLKKTYPEFDFNEGKVDEKGVESQLKKEVKKEEVKKNFEEFQEKWKSFNEKSKKTLGKLGLYPLMFAYKTPYEKLMFERMTKQMQRGPGVAFGEVDNFLKKKAGVPGA